MQWKPQQWYAGQDVYIIGGGYSLKTFDWKRLYNKITIGCNDAYRLGPSVCNVCTFADHKWHNKNGEEIKSFPNPVITNHKTFEEHKEVLYLERVDHGLAKDKLGFNGNTGCIAVNLALILGARRILLLGFDMKLVDPCPNWHEFNVGKPNVNSYIRFKQGFERMASDLATVFPGREIINLGPDSELEMFPTKYIYDFI